eukprot:m.50031 g.50031  ORF g.50031 m.50031 type:complete len:119 (-) comp48051_c0_seq3:30-386(-)
MQHFRPIETRNWLIARQPSRCSWTMAHKSCSRTQCASFLANETAKDMAARSRQMEIMALLQAHEDFLANLGANTKPALRTPLAAHEQDHAGPGVVDVVSLLDLDNPGQPILEDDSDVA